MSGLLDSTTTPFSLTILSATRGNASKRLIPDAHGQPIKDPKHSLSIAAGRVEHVQVAGLAGLSELLQRITPQQALVNGIPNGSSPGEVFDLVTSKNYTGTPGTIARTLACFDYPAGCRVVMFDRDPDPLAPTQVTSAQDLIACLAGIWSVFADIGWLRTTSTSSAIKDTQTHAWLKAPDGMHVYCLVTGDVARFRELLDVRSWLAGYGFCRLATPNKATGVTAILRRTLVDLTVLSPKRLDYVAGAQIPIDAPFYQDRPAPELHPGHVLDLDSLPDLAPDEWTRYTDVVEAARNALVPEQRATVRAHIVAATPTLSAAAVEQEITTRLEQAEQGELPPTHLLYLNNGVTCTADKLSQALDGVRLRDPLEPDYGPSQACFHWRGSDWRIVSWAHGIKKVYHRALPEDPRPAPDESDWGPLLDQSEQEAQRAQNGAQALPRSRRKNGQHAQPKALKVTQLSTVRPERVEFLWKPFLPKGRPVAIEGDPGVGKSALVAKIIAHVTTGKAFPTVLDDTPPFLAFIPKNVCILTSEDDPADTLVPRIIVNGGDVQRVFHIQGWEQPDGAQGIVTLQDLTLLKEALERYTPALLVFDPIQSFFGRGVDMNHANETRPVLDAVAAVCKAHDCTPLYVRHVGKARREKAIHASLGSIDITGNMRSVLFLARDPENNSRRILAHSKINNAPLGQSLAYTVRSVEEDIPTPDGGMVTIEAPRLGWDGLSTLTADDLASPPLQEGEEKPAFDQAREFLEELLAPGPVLYTDVQRAMKQAGISLVTLKRAKPLVGVRSRRRPEDGTPSKDWSWEWFLESPRDSCPDACGDDTLEPLEKSPINSNGYDKTPRGSYDPLGSEPQAPKKQQVALEYLEDHPHVSTGDSLENPLLVPNDHRASGTPQDPAVEEVF
jgi:hypothetical protein